MIASSWSEALEYVASQYKVNAGIMGVSRRTLISTDPDDMHTSSDDSSAGSDNSGSSSDEIEIIQELTVTPEKHQCSLCFRGNYVVDRLLEFGGLNQKYACEMCLESFKTKSLARKHAEKHRLHSAESPVVNARTGVAVIEAAAIGEASTSAMDTSAESGSFTCHICETHCKSEKGLKRHNTNKHGVTHSCSVCGTHFKVLRDFQQHCKKNTCSPSSTVRNGTSPLGVPKLLSCPTCPKNFLFQKSLEEHVCRLVS